MIHVNPFMTRKRASSNPHYLIFDDLRDPSDLANNAIMDSTDWVARDEPFKFMRQYPLDSVVVRLALEHIQGLKGRKPR